MRPGQNVWNPRGGGVGISIIFNTGSMAMGEVNQAVCPALDSTKFSFKEVPGEREEFRVECKGGILHALLPPLLLLHFSPASASPF